MRIRFLLLFLVCSVIVKAQQWPFELWHEGMIVLEKGDTLRGFVKYDLQQDLVQFNIKDKVIETYTARKVIYFEIFDAMVHKHRKFFTIPYNIKGGYSTQVFFELLAEGKITLLAREALEQKNYSSPYYVGSYSKLVLVYKYFILDSKENITEFTGGKDELLDLLEPQSEEVRKYIRANKLDIKDKYDFTKVIEYYNSLAGL